MRRMMRRGTCHERGANVVANNVLTCLQCTKLGA
jgi:hypothetical protein